MKVQELGSAVRMMRHVPMQRLTRHVQLHLKQRLRPWLERAAPGKVRPTILADARPPSQWRQAVLPVSLPDNERMFQDQVSAWMQANPPYQNDYWQGEYNPSTVSDRVLFWMHSLAALELSAAERAPIERSLIEQLAYLHRNLRTDLGGHELVRNLHALRWGAACFEGPDPKSWAKTADTLIGTVLQQEIGSDGFHIEGSSSVHLAVFADLLAIHEVLPEGDLQRDLASVLGRMAYAATFVTAVDGEPLLLGTTQVTTVYTTHDLLKAWSAAGGTVDAIPPVGALADAGVYAYRDDKDMVVVDAGPLGDPARPRAAHADALSLTWILNGQRILVDAGGQSEEARRTSEHNTLTLDDLDQAEFFNDGRVGRRWTIHRTAWMPRADGFVLTASHDGYAHLSGSPVHRRTVEVKGHKIRVEDRVEGGEGQRAVSRLLLHPDVHVQVLGSGAILSIGDQRIDLRTSAAVRCVDATWWAGVDAPRPTQRLELDLGAAPCSARFTLQATTESN
ncbi:MAG: heparinase II/III family protein [Myxococcota bacterium]